MTIVRAIQTSFEIYKTNFVHLEGLIWLFDILYLSMLFSLSVFGTDCHLTELKRIHFAGQITRQCLSASCLCVGKIIFCLPNPEKFLSSDETWHFKKSFQKFTLIFSCWKNRAWIIFAWTFLDGCVVLIHIFYANIYPSHIPLLEHESE